jgi:hypothetical protein
LLVVKTLGVQKIDSIQSDYQTPRWRGFAIRAAENLNLRFLIV